MHRRRWPWIVVCAGLIVFGFGLAGFAEHFRQNEKTKTTLDLFYVTGQLFAMNSGAVEGDVPWKLEIARFLAPLVAASAVLGTLAAVFSDEWRRWFLRFRRGHVIVCGLGRKGGRLVEELHQEGNRIVVIEPDEHNPGLSRCRDLKVIVIPGRSDDDWTLTRARVRTAARLITTAGDDSINVETAVRAHALAQGRDAALDPLHCVAHITDPGLQQLLKSHHLFGDRSDPFDLELVNVYEAGARVMVERAELWRGGSGAQPKTARVCVVGLGHFGEAVLRRLLRDWAIRRAESTNALGSDAHFRLEIVIVDRETKAKEESVRQRFSDFLPGVELHFVGRDVRAPDFAGVDLAITRPSQSMDAFFVCFDDDSLATIAALRIRERFGPVAPIVVRMTEQTGFASLMQGGPISGIRPIGFLDIACMRDLFLGGDTEIIARAFHEAYLEERLAAGDTPESNPAAVSWERLEETNRASSRARAVALRDQLDRVGLLLIPCPDRPIALHRFESDTLESLAEAEHERWLAIKSTEGWRHGSVRDKAKKLNPFLVKWGTLPESEKEFNRVTVRRLPAILARADFEIRAR